MLTEFGCQIAPSTYYAALSRPKSAREVRDEELVVEIRRVYAENYEVYGATGAVRGKTVRTTVSDKDGVRLLTW